MLRLFLLSKTIYACVQPTFKEHTSHHIIISNTKFDLHLSSYQFNACALCVCVCKIYMYIIVILVVVVFYDLKK